MYIFKVFTSKDPGFYVPRSIASSDVTKCLGRHLDLIIQDWRNATIMFVRA